MQKIKLAGLLLLLFLVVGCERSVDEKELISFTGSTMGTTYSVKFTVNTDLSFNTSFVKGNVDSVLAEVNRQMSTYIPDSEISTFNSSRDTGWFNISADFARVLTAANEVSKQSGGAFDITVSPLINLWGFGPQIHENEIPSDADILESKKFVGYWNLEVDTVNNRIKKSIPELTIDLSAIAKGYGVDKVAEYLEDRGFKNYMVEIGGEVRTKGHPATASEWKIGISTPDNNFGIQSVLHLNDISVATSGDYRNYFEKDGVRYSHTIDPNTGKPITHNLASVSVIHPSCMYADAYATAMSVMGADKAMEFAEKNGLDIYLLKKEAEEFVEGQTRGMDKYLVIYENGEEKK